MTNFTNFRFETDADGIALATWDMPGRSMNVITPEVMDELAQIIDTVPATRPSRAASITSGKEAFSGGADLTMLQGLGAEYARLAKEKGEEAAMHLLLRGVAQGSRCSTAGSRPAASRSRRPCTASASAAPSSWRSPAITACSRMPTRPASACPRSRSASSRAPAARSAWRA